MILSMPTTARSQRRYDHRLRDLVQRTGDVTIATDLGVPRSTARGWLGVAPTAVICLDDVDLNQPRRQGRDVMMTDFDSLPMPLQRAIATRDAAVKPFMATIESLDVSWTIVRGNLGDLLGTIDVFAADDEARAIALWREPPQVKHRYHLTVVRTFHNFLSAAVAHLEHSK